MTLLSTVIADLQRATARTDDEAQSLMIRGVNAGVIAAALIYRPGELKTNGSITAVSTANYASLSTLSRWMSIDEIQNVTGSCRVWPLEFAELNTLEVPTTGNVLFYAIYGNDIHYRPQPALNETLTVYYFALPARLTALGDTLPLDDYQDFILSFAQSFVWASLEEPESSAVWQKLTEMTGIPWKEMTQIRDLLTQQVPYVRELQTAVSKGIASNPAA